MHSCWCILLFECGLNSNLHLNSNLFELEIEEKKFWKRKTSQNPKPGPSQPSTGPLPPLSPAAHIFPSWPVSFLPAPAAHAAALSSARPGLPSPPGPVFPTRSSPDRLPARPTPAAQLTPPRAGLRSSAPSSPGPQASRDTHTPPRSARSQPRSHRQLDPTGQFLPLRRDARAEQTRRDPRAAPVSLARTPRSAGL